MHKWSDQVVASGLEQGVVIGSSTLWEEHLRPACFSIGALADVPLLMGGDWWTAHAEACIHQARALSSPPKLAF